MYTYIHRQVYNHDTNCTTVIELIDMSKHDNSVFAPTGHKGMTATVIIYYTAWDHSLEVVLKVSKLLICPGKRCIGLRFVTRCYEY